MKHTPSYTVHIAAILFGGLALAMAFVLISPPLSAEAATYAYVDSFGDVKSVVANSWQTAISTALNIHPQSGVMLLESTADFDIVGNSVVGY